MSAHALYIVHVGAVIADGVVETVSRDLADEMPAFYNTVADLRSPPGPSDDVATREAPPAPPPVTGPFPTLADALAARGNGK